MILKSFILFQIHKSETIQKNNETKFLSIPKCTVSLKKIDNPSILETNIDDYLKSNSNIINLYFEMVEFHCTFDSLIIVFEGEQKPTQLKILNMTTAKQHDLIVNEKFLSYLKYFFEKLKVDNIDFIYVLPEYQFEKNFCAKFKINEKLNENSKNLWDKFKSKINLKLININQQAIKKLY